MGGGGLVAPEKKLLPGFRIVRHAIDLSLSMLQLFEELLPLGQGFLDFGCIVPVDEEALFINVLGKAVAAHDSPEITEGSHGVVQQFSQFFAQEVVELSDSV